MLEGCKSCASTLEDGTRKAHHSESFKTDIKNRLKRIEGQIRGIGKMVDEDIYCDDILNQMNSVAAALNGARKTLLEAHLKSCVIDQIKEGKVEVVDELMKTMDRMLK